MPHCDSRSALIPDDELEKYFTELSERHALTVALLRRHVEEQRAGLGGLVAALERVQHWADSPVDGAMPVCSLCQEVASAHLPDCELGRVLTAPTAEHGRRWLESARQVEEKLNAAEEVAERVGTALAEVWHHVIPGNAEEAAVAVLRAAFPALPVPVGARASAAPAEDGLAGAVCWRSGRLRVVRKGAQPPQLQVYAESDGEQPEWYVPALPWTSEPAVSALIQELVFELSRQGGRT